MAMPANEVLKSLQRLEELAKASTKKSQLYHTPENSEPNGDGEWAGSKPQDVDEHHDNVDASGTDYTGVKKALAKKVEKSKSLTPAEVAIAKGQNPMPLITEKMAKAASQGMDALAALTPAERWVVHGGLQKMQKAMAAKLAKAEGSDGPRENLPEPGTNFDRGGAPETNAAKDDKDELQDDGSDHGAKSLAALAAKSQTMKSAMNVAPFLYEFARASNLAQESATKRLGEIVEKAVTGLAGRLDKLEKSIDSRFSKLGEYNSDMAKAVAGIGYTVQETANAQAVEKSLPQGGPKTTARSGQTGPGASGINPLLKGFGTTGPDTLTKSQVTDILVKLTDAQKINPYEVHTWEMLNSISGHAQKEVMSFANDRTRQ